MGYESSTRANGFQGNVLNAKCQEKCWNQNDL